MNQPIDEMTEVEKKAYYMWTSIAGTFSGEGGLNFAEAYQVFDDNDTKYLTPEEMYAALNGGLWRARLKTLR